MRELEIHVGEGAQRRRRRRRGKWLLPLLLGIVAAFLLTREKPQTPVPPRTVSVPPKPALNPTPEPTLNPVSATTPEPPAETPPAPAPARVTVAPTQIDFGELVPPRFVPAQMLTIRNDGGEAAPAVTIATSGPFLATNGCSHELPPAAECAIAVVFAPRKAGSFTGVLRVTSAAEHADVALRGTMARVAPVETPAPRPQSQQTAQSVPPAPLPAPPAPAPVPPPRVLCFDPPSIHFLTTGRQDITLTNPGPLPLRVVAILPVGQQGQTISGYEVDPGRCLREIAPGRQCRFSVRANQLALQRREMMQLTVYYDDPLTGTRRAASVSSACR